MKRHPLNLDDYQAFVTEFHGESDRSAIVMGGSFAEHYLATYLREFMIDEEEVERLFEAGPLSGFDARINLAYALRLISKSHREDLRVIKDVRNRVAHSPRLVSLQRDEIKKDIQKLSMWSTVHEGPGAHPLEMQARIAFLLSVGMFVLFAHQEIQKERQKRSGSKP